MTYYKGYYYLATTTAVDVKVRRAKRIEDLRSAEDVVVYRDEDPSRNRDVWAPEIHRYDGKWWLYVCAGDGHEPSHRITVAEGTGDTPIDPFKFKSVLKTDPANEYYAIDFHPFRLDDGRMYGVWCGRPSASGQGLYIARMKDPYTLEGPRQYLDVSGFGCQWVREGPATLLHDGKVYLTYSACSADTPDYKIGLTVADAKANLLDPTVWHQHPDPIFTRNDAAKVYGVGHHIFFKSPDGKEDWIVFHAKSTTKTSYADRWTRAQPFRWKDGLPDLGKPLGSDVDIPVPSGER